MAGAVETAKLVLEADEAVLYGIFGLIGASVYFPPRDFLNEFLMVGNDPCDQDGRMSGAVRPLALGVRGGQGVVGGRPPRRGRVRSRRRLLE